MGLLQYNEYCTSLLLRWCVSAASYSVRQALICWSTDWRHLSINTFKSKVCSHLEVCVNTYSMKWGNNTDKVSSSLLFVLSLNQKLSFSVSQLYLSSPFLFPKTFYVRCALNSGEHNLKEEKKIANLCQCLVSVNPWYQKG